MNKSNLLCPSPSATAFYEMTASAIGIRNDSVIVIDIAGNDANANMHEPIHLNALND